MTEQATFSALVMHLRRALADATKTRADIKALSLEAFAKLQEGTTAVGVSFSSGNFSTTVNCDPAIMLQACEQVLEETDEENDLAGAAAGFTAADLSGQHIEP